MWLRPYASLTLSNKISKFSNTLDRPNKRFSTGFSEKQIGTLLMI